MCFGSGDQSREFLQHFQRVENDMRGSITPASTAVDVSIVEERDSLVVSVRDYGPGVPQALLPRLTDPFFRVDAARDANTGGIGLGLAIAKRALEIHHGTLVAENAHPGLRVLLAIPRTEFATRP
jgi:two-component system sensor histidine kinase CpxA